MIKERLFGTYGTDVAGHESLPGELPLDSSSASSNFRNDSM